MTSKKNLTRADPLNRVEWRGELANCCIPQLLGEMQQYNTTFWIMNE